MFNPNNVDGQVTIFDVIMLQQPLFIVNQRPTMVHGLNMFKITIKLMQNSPKIHPARILLGDFFPLVFFPFKNFNSSQLTNTKFSDGYPTNQDILAPRLSLELKGGGWVDRRFTVVSCRGVGVSYKDRPMGMQ